MAIRTKQTEKNTLYYNTFTCFEWHNLIELTDLWSEVYFWFNNMRLEYGVELTGYVIMPNHVHSKLYLPKGAPDINSLLSNGKRFLAYEIIERLEQRNERALLQRLHDAVSPHERSKGQLHKVFTVSSDIKQCYSEKFILQKLNYMHKNPVVGKWNLVEDYTLYPHSSAGFYERNVQGVFPVMHYKDVWNTIL